MTRWVFNEDGWTDWIDHDVMGCPCVGWWVHVVHNTGIVMEVIAGSGGGLSWDWSNYPQYSRIIRYRIRKPKGAETLERLVQDMPETVDA